MTDYGMQLRAKFPSIAWDEPVLISLLDGSAAGYACRICIAMHAMHGSAVKSLPNDADVVRQHIKQAHP